MIRPTHDIKTQEAYVKYNEDTRYYWLKEDEYRRLQELLNTEGD